MTTNTPCTVLLDLADRFGRTTDRVTDWDAATPCSGWTAHDVLDHVVDTQRDFLVLRGAPLGGRPTSRGSDLWAAHIDQVRPVVSDEAFAGTEYDGHFGRTTVGETLAGFYGFDLVVHRWDLARSHHLPEAWSDDELDLVEQRLEVLGEAIRMDGVCGPPVDVPPDAPRQARLLGRMGRRP